MASVDELSEAVNSAYLFFKALLVISRQEGKVRFEGFDTTGKNYSVTLSVDYNEDLLIPRRHYKRFEVDKKTYEVYNMTEA